MSYKEPKKKYHKISPFFVQSIASALSREHKVKVRRGDNWALDMKNKELIYTEEICNLDQDAVLALLLHEVGHLRFSTIFDGTTDIAKKYPESSHHCVNAIEDTRIDYIMSGMYANSGDLITTLYMQSANNGLIKLEKFNDDMKEMQNKHKECDENLEKATKEHVEGNVSEADLKKYKERIDQQKEESSMQSNPVSECMWIFLTKYHGYGDCEAIKNYYRQDVVDIADKVLEKQYSFNPENMPDTKTVQDYFEKEIFPLIEPLIPKNEDGSEKKMQLKYDLTSEDGRMLAKAKQLLKGIKDMLQKEAIKDGIPINDRGVGKERPVNTNVDYRQYIADIQSLINGSTARFKRILKDNSFGRYAGRHKSGQLNTKKLYKHRTQDYRLFQRKTERANKSYAFSIMLDCSGSMDGSPIKESMKGVVLLNEVLSRCGVETETIFFSSQYEIGKSFDEPLSRNKMARAAGAVWEGGTDIEEPFRIMVQNISKRKTGHKICIVLTDGAIIGGGEIEELMRKHDDIMYYGIGIGVDIKDIFGENSIEVSNVQEIVPKFSDIIRKHIKIG